MDHDDPAGAAALPRTDAGWPDPRGAHTIAQDGNDAAALSPDGAWRSSGQARRRRIPKGSGSST
jgi:hypothetical protein